ncbi:hypothetical protein OKW34_004612 [Paraburkholderia youngii]|uniref:hypothetical protein n=1 Tax=Paraburkholderia youngii TaxID=2782701 RepID=UPI0020CC2CE1|nr:hypothetical protein [Paraburkholderia youngii]
MSFRYRALVAVLGLCAGLCAPSFAEQSIDAAAKHTPSSTGCRFVEHVELQLPFNTTALSKDNRLSIQKAVKEAQKWPDVRIQAIVIAGAYIGERDLDILQDRRGEVVKGYLRKLGIPSPDIYIEPKTLTDVFAQKLPDGKIRVNQIEIELSPICKGSCEWMCDDPRVTPRSRVINP